MRSILSSYPLTRDSTDLLAESGTKPRAITLNELRLLSPLKILGAVRTVDTEVLTVVVQEASEKAVLPLMLTLASLSRARRLEVRDLSAGTIVQVSRMRAAMGFLGTVAATVSGQFSIARLNLLCRSLLRTSASQFGPLAGNKALYLKSNLMLGVKAGGSIGHIAGVANELLRLDPRMQILAPEPPPLVKPDARFVPIEALRSYGIPAEANHFRFNWNCVATGARAMVQEKFDFIYQRLSLGNLSGVLLSRRFQIPLVLEYNGSEVWISSNWGHSLRYRRLASLIEDCCLHHAHRIVTVSEVLADELKQRGVPAEKIVWYPNCIDPDMFDPRRYVDSRKATRDRLGLRDDELAVLFLGTFGVWHGAETLAEAARQYLESAPATAQRVRFVFVGDGLRLAAVRKILKAEISAGLVILTGLVPQDQAPEYLAAADIFMSPHVQSTDGSKFFGSPTKLFEYMAMERPIIASALDQLTQVLNPALDEVRLSAGQAPTGDETAILTAPGDVQALVRALTYLRDRPAICESLARAARRRALEHYTWARHVEVIMRALR